MVKTLLRSTTVNQKKADWLNDLEYYKGSTLVAVEKEKTNRKK